jgi:hypothetical protein
MLDLTELATKEGWKDFVYAGGRPDRIKDGRSGACR